MSKSEDLPADGNNMALLQLVCHGKQDIVLTHEPDITLFRTVHARHTNFATTPVHQTYTGTVRPNQSINCRLSRSADMVNRIWIEAEVTCTGPTSFPLENMIQSVELQIGGNRIDRIDSTVLRLYDELYRNGDEKDAYYRMANFSDEESDAATPTNPIKRKLYLPLIFFFNTDIGMSLPILAMQFHEVDIKIQFANSVSGVANIEDTVLSVYADYVFLDDPERMSYGKNSTQKEMLITQWQIHGKESTTLPSSGESKGETSQSIRLNFNHPVRALIWTVTGDVFGHFNNSHPAPFNITDKAGPFTDGDSKLNDAYAILKSASLSFNGTERLPERSATYFNRVQPMVHFKSTPSAGVYVYSFAENPRGNQPTGQVNMSRIDSCILYLKFKSVDPSVSSAGGIPTDDVTVNNLTNLKNVEVFCMNYNLIRFAGGMAGLAFSG